jgi:hypothetical protein
MQNVNLSLNDNYPVCFQSGGTAIIFPHLASLIISQCVCNFSLLVGLIKLVSMW